MNLWNKEEGKEDIKIIFEQYKLCVDLADKISSRRATANGFFLTLNSSIIAIISLMVKEDYFSSTPWIVIPFLMIGILLCYIWYALIKSYRQLNTAKFLVIGKMEEKLPASPLFRAEWTALGEGKDSKIYTPLTSIEKYIPLIFVLMYFLTCLLIFTIEV